MRNSVGTGTPQPRSSREWFAHLRQEGLGTDSLSDVPVVPQAEATEPGSEPAAEFVPSEQPADTEPAAKFVPSEQPADAEPAAEFVPSEPVVSEQPGQWSSTSWLQRMRENAPDPSTVGSPATPVVEEAPAAETAVAAEGTPAGEADVTAAEEAPTTETAVVAGETPVGEAGVTAEETAVAAEELPAQDAGVTVAEEVAPAANNESAPATEGTPGQWTSREWFAHLRENNLGWDTLKDVPTIPAPPPPPSQVVENEPVAFDQRPHNPAPDEDPFAIFNETAPPAEATPQFAKFQQRPSQPWSLETDPLFALPDPPPPPTRPPVDDSDPFAVWEASLPAGPVQQIGYGAPPRPWDPSPRVKKTEYSNGPMPMQDPWMDRSASFVEQYPVWSTYPTWMWMDACLTSAMAVPMISGFWLF